jgi:hypothetical protein
MLSRVYSESCLAARSHLGGGFFDGLFRYAMGDEPLAKLLDGAFFARWASLSARCWRRPFEM